MVFIFPLLRQAAAVLKCFIVNKQLVAYKHVKFTFMCKYANMCLDFWAFVKILLFTIHQNKSLCCKPDIPGGQSKRKKSESLLFKEALHVGTANLSPFFCPV